MTKKVKKSRTTKKSSKQPKRNLPEPDPDDADIIRNSKKSKPQHQEPTTEQKKRFLGD